MNEKSLMKFGKWSLILFSLVFLGFTVINFTIPILAGAGSNYQINVTLNSPNDNGFSTTSVTNFTFTPQWNASIEISNCTLYGNFTEDWAAKFNTWNITPLVSGVVNGINTSLSDGHYKWNVYCYNLTQGVFDYASPNRTVTVDTAGPLWTGNTTSPTSGGTYSPTQTYRFNITVTDGNSVSNVTLEFDHVNYTDTTKDGNVYFKNLGPLAANTTGHSLKWYMNDSANNWNVSDTWSFVIQMATSSLSIGPLTSVTYGTSTQTGCELVTGDVSTWAIILYRNGTSFVGTTSPKNETAIVLGAGTYNYTCAINTTQNYTGSVLSDQYRTLNKTDNILTSLTCSPSNPTYPTIPTCTGGQASTGDSDVTYYLYRNGSQVDSQTNANVSESILLGATDYSYKFNSSEGTNYTANSTGISLALTVNQNQTNLVKLYLNDQLNTNVTMNYGQSNVTGLALYTNSGTLYLYKNGVNVTSTENNQLITGLPVNTNGYLYKVNITGNANYTSNVTGTSYYLFVNKTTCGIDLWLNSGTADNDVTITYPTQANATATINVTGVTWNITRNGTNVAGGTGTLTDLTTLGSSTYNYTGHWNGNENYTGCSEESILTINKGNLTFSISGSDVTYPSSVSISTSENNDGDTDINYTLYRNGTQVNLTTGYAPSITELLGVDAYLYKLNVTTGANWTANTTGVTKTIIVSQGSNPVYLYLNGNLLTTNFTVNYGQLNLTGVATGGSANLYKNGVNVTTTENSQSIYLPLNSTGYSYKINTTGNQNYIANSTGVTYNITVIKATTNISLYLNGTQGNRNYVNNTGINVTASLNVSGKAIYFETNFTGLPQQTGTTPLANYTELIYNSSYGTTYNVTGWFAGDANYTSSSTTYYVTITQSTTTTTTAASTTTTVSSGGGGGTTTTAPPSKSHIWEKMTPGSAEIMKVDDPDIGLKQITITVRNPVKTITITVTKLAGKPASVTHEVSGKVYKYIEIVPKNIPDENISSAKIQFKVNKSWITGNNIDKTRVYLNRYHNNTWQRLTTRTTTTEDTTYIYYEADSPGFSTFAVTGEELTTTTVATTAATTIATTVPTTISTTTPAMPPIIYGVPTETIILLVIIVIVVIALLAWKFMPRKRKLKGLTNLLQESST